MRRKNYIYPRETNGVGEQVKIHRRIAAEALGRSLPSKAVVHHVNEDETDYRNDNLVICQDERYHNLLHLRTRAYRACRHADWRQCIYCRQWAPLSEMTIYTQATGYQSSPRHLACAREDIRLRQQSKRAAQGYGK